MDEQDWLAERFEETPHPPARGRLPDARLAERGRRRRAGGVAAAQPLRRERRREPRRLADDGRRAGLPRTCCARASRGARSRSSAHVPEPIVEPGRRRRPRARGAARRLGRARAARGARDAARRPSGSRSCCTTCSRCRSTRSRRSSAARPTAARQLASRARRRVQGAARVPDADLARQREVVDAFLAAARDGDFEALVAVLDPDVVLRSDRRLRDARARRACSAARAPWPSTRCMFAQLSPFVRPALVNGAAGVVVVSGGPRVLGHGLHGRGREDRRDRRARRSRAPRPPRSGVPRGLTDASPAISPVRASGRRS